MPAFLIPVIAKLLGIGRAIRGGFAWLADHPKALVAVGVAVLVALLWLQSARLSHAKADLKAARAALVDPVTHKPWQAEAQVAARDLTTCRANTSTLQAAITAQNASLAAWSERGRRATAEAENAVQRSRSAVAAAEKAKAVIAAPLSASDDTCSRAQEVDRRVMETLR
jgi:hypothetical protein